MNAEPINRTLSVNVGRTHAEAEAGKAAIRLLVGTILAGLDELLRETRAVRRTNATDWAVRLGEVTAQLSIAELTTAGHQLRAALASLEYSADLLGFQHQQLREPPAPGFRTLAVAAQ